MIHKHIQLFCQNGSKYKEYFLSNIFPFSYIRVCDKKYWLSIDYKYVIKNKYPVFVLVSFQNSGIISSTYFQFDIGIGYVVWTWDRTLPSGYTIHMP